MKRNKVKPEQGLLFRNKLADFISSVLTVYMDLFKLHASIYFYEAHDSDKNM